MININFLGTSQAVPTAKRNHVSILLSYANENILVDCGEGTQRQFRKAKLNPCKLTKILISHWHGDHILGLPGLIQTLALNGYNKTLEIYGPKGTKRYIEELFKIFIFQDEKIKINVKEVKGKFFENSDFILEAFRLRHSAPCLGYNFILKDKLNINKQKLKKLKLKPGAWLNNIKKGKDIVINKIKVKAKDLVKIKKGKKISFVLDTSYFSSLINNIKNSDLLIIESTYSEKDKDKARKYRHLTSAQAAKIAKQAKVNKLILTHISQRYEKNLKQIEVEAKKTFKNTQIAYDLMKVSV